MATITVKVEAQNSLERMYFLKHDDFQVVKEAVKSTGARFDGRNKVWLMTQQQFSELKFDCEAADFYVSRTNDVIFRAMNEVVWSPHPI